MFDLPISVLQQLKIDSTSIGDSKTQDLDDEGEFLSVLSQEIEIVDPKEGNIVAVAEDLEVNLTTTEVNADAMKMLNIEVAKDLEAEEIVTIIAENDEQLTEHEEVDPLTQNEFMPKQIVATNTKETNVKNESIDSNVLLAVNDDQSDSEQKQSLSCDIENNNEGGGFDFRDEDHSKHVINVVSTSINFAEEVKETIDDSSAIELVANDVSLARESLIDLKPNESNESLTTDIDNDLPKFIASFDNQLEQVTEEELHPQEDLQTVAKVDNTNSDIKINAASNIETREVTVTSEQESFNGNIINEQNNEYNIEANIEDKDWSPEVAGKLALMKTNGINKASLKLNPPELGKLEISLEMNDDNLNIVFSSKNSQVRETIDISTNKLQQMFTKDEVSSVNITVNSQAGNDAGRESSQQEQQRTLGDIGKLNQAEDEVETVVNVVEKKNNSMVDYYA